MSNLYPIPPSVWQVLIALFICIAATVFYFTGELIAFYIGLFRVIQRGDVPAQLRQASQVRRSAFTALSAAATAIKRIYNATIRRHRQR